MRHRKDDDMTTAQAAPDRQLPVTQEDIDHAVARDQFNCAIVRAIQRKYPEAVRVRANSKHIGFSLPAEDNRYTYPTPPAAVDRIIKPLDRNEPPEPMRLHLSGGEVRQIHHGYDDPASAEHSRKERDRERARNPEEKRQRPSSRQQQMSPGWAEYERFSPDA